MDGEKRLNVREDFPFRFIGIGCVSGGCFIHRFSVIQRLFLIIFLRIFRFVCILFDLRLYHRADTQTDSALYRGGQSGYALGTAVGVCKCQ